MSDELETSEVKPGHMKPIEPIKPKVTKIVHGNVERLTNPASSLKITSGLGTQAQNNGNEIVLATQAMPLDVWQAVPEVPKADESEIIGRFDDPLGLYDGYPVTAPNDEWHLWTTSAGNKTESKLGVTVKLFNRELTFDSTGTLVKIKPKSTTAQDTRYLHPWQCYITASVADSCSVKINPVSTLMQTYNYRASWDLSTWKDAWTHANITNFTNTFVLTASDHCVWMEVVFASGDISTVTIRNGVPGAVTWNADLRYVSADNRAAGSRSFTWYQLLAYFKPSASGDGGSEVDAVFSGVNYKLMCPTTTHLMQGYITAVDLLYLAPGDPHFHIAIVPWYGCWFPTS